MRKLLPVVLLILSSACASRATFRPAPEPDGIKPAAADNHPFAPRGAKAGKTAAAEKLTLADKFDLYFKHYEHDHFSSDAWKGAFKDEALTNKLGWLVVFGASFALDSGVENHFEKHDLYGDAAKMDDWLLVAFPLTTAAMTLLAPPGKFENRYDHLAAFNETLIAAGAASFVLKAIVNRSRPGGKGDDSFPSNHALLSFATAKFISETWGREHGLKVKVPAYLLATFISTSRLERRKHHLSDVIGGAAIGYLIADVFAKWHFGPGGINEGANVALFPAVSPEGVGLFAEYRF